MTPFFKLPPFLFSSQRNADVLKPKLSLSFGDLQVTGFESARPQLQKHNHTLEKCWECPNRLRGSDFNHRHMNISHSSTERFQDVTDVFTMLYEESDSLHHSSLSHIKDTFATQSGSGFRVRRMDGGSGSFCLSWNQRGRLELTIWWKSQFIGRVAPLRSAEPIQTADDSSCHQVELSDDLQRGNWV